MRQHNQKEVAGVWVDHQKAIIITKESGEYAVKEKIDGPGTFISDNELHRNNAKHADLLSFFKSLSEHLQPYDRILLFGTGIAQEQFHNYLNENSKFNVKQITVENTGQLTDHQMIAKVQDFFN